MKRDGAVGAALAALGGEGPAQRAAARGLDPPSGAGALTAGRTPPRGAHSGGWASGRAACAEPRVGCEQRAGAAVSSCPGSLREARQRPVSSHRSFRGNGK